MSLRKRRIRDFIKDEKEGAREYYDMAKRTNNKDFAAMYREMAKDEEKHLKMLEKILKQEPCEEQNIIKRRRNVRRTSNGRGRNRRT